MRRWLLLGITLLALAGTVPARAQATPPVKVASLSSATCPGTGCTVVGVSERGYLGVQATGTFSGTLTFKGSVANSTDCSTANFVAFNVVPAASATPVSTSTAVGAWQANIAGYTYFCIVFTAYSSGTAVITTRSAP